MSDVTKKRARILGTFKDEGTGESFKSGDKPLLEAGQFANYEAAGLAEAAPAAKAAARAPAKPKSKSKSKAARATKPAVPAQPVQPPAPDQGGGSA